MPALESSLCSRIHSLLRCFVSSSFAFFVLSLNGIRKRDHSSVLNAHALRSSPHSRGHVPLSGASCLRAPSLEVCEIAGGSNWLISWGSGFEVIHGSFLLESGTKTSFGSGEKSLSRARVSLPLEAACASPLQVAACHVLSVCHARRLVPIPG